MRHTPSRTVLLILLLMAAASFEDAVAQRTVTVMGEGVMTVLPDQAVVRFGIVSTSSSPEEARAMNASAAAAALNEVRGLGVADNHIRVDRLQLQPERRYNPETRTYDQIGFEAIRDVSVTLTDLDQLPILVARIVQSGANRLNGITYELSDRESILQEALKLAAQNARLKANLLATTLGATLGPVSQISEQGIQIPRPSFRLDEAVMMSARSDAPPNPAAFASGEMEVRATVTVVFLLD